jgi:molecular chaperone GrpE
VNKNKKNPNRIPVRFADADEPSEKSDVNGAANAPASDKNHRESEDGLDSVLSENNDLDALRGDDVEAADEVDEVEDAYGEISTDDADRLTASPAEDDSLGASAPGAELAYGPMMAELIATRSELRRVEAELKKLSGDKLDLTDRLARRQADFENYRKRVERERAETATRATGDLVSRLLPVIDNLSRALAAEASVAAGESEEFRHFVHGVELIEKQLTGVLNSLGVESVPTVGEKFDPHVHEAVITVETDEVEPDTIIEEMRKGYRIGGKLLRPAMVKVSK